MNLKFNFEISFLFFLLPYLSLQCGVLLEILHSLAMEVKEHKHLDGYLHERAVAALRGDWEGLKMPNPNTEADQRNLAKRVALQSLNPFNMSKTSVPPVVATALSNLHQGYKSTITNDATPLQPGLRPVDKMAKLNTGYKVCHVILLFLHCAFTDLSFLCSFADFCCEKPRRKGEIIRSATSPNRTLPGR